jgi:hypothetical protein
MLTVYAPEIRAYENLWHFSSNFRNLNEAAESATEPGSVELNLRFTTLFVRQTPGPLWEDRRGDHDVPT